MSKCPGCNKFASLEEPEVEDSGFEWDGQWPVGAITVSATLIRNSTCCGEEIRRGELEGTVDIEHECPNDDIVGREVYNPDSDETFTVDQGFTDPEGELDSAYVSGEGRKADVGATGQVTVKCRACGEEIELPIEEGIVEMGALDMEDVTQ
jgi:hypothetical protein